MDIVMNVECKVKPEDLIELSRVWLNSAESEAVQLVPRGTEYYPALMKWVGGVRITFLFIPNEEKAMSDQIPGGNIGWAVMKMQQGFKVRRRGWNGKGMFVVLMPELKLPPFSSQQPGAKVNDRTAKYIGNDTPLDSQPYIAMWTAQGKWQPGWLCSQADLLATDWELAE